MSVIEQIVASLPARSDEVAEWLPLRFRVRAYLTDDLPPLELVSSVRAVVRNHNDILVVRDPVSTHILPGGRREGCETLLQTLQREVLEETGWSICEIRLIGFAHFRHLTPEPADYRYPYPDFLHLVYVAAADRYHPERREVRGYELGAAFLPIERVMNLPISQGERIFLNAALT